MLTGLGSAGVRRGGCSLWRGWLCSARSRVRPACGTCHGCCSGLRYANRGRCWLRVCATPSHGRVHPPCHRLRQRLLEVAVQRWRRVCDPGKRRCRTERLGVRLCGYNWPAGGLQYCVATSDRDRCWQQHTSIVTNCFSTRSLHSTPCVRLLPALR